jgi:hypothetical protein
VLIDRQAHLTNHVIRPAKTSRNWGWFVRFTCYAIRNFLFVNPEVRNLALGDRFGSRHQAIVDGCQRRSCQTICA